MQIKKFLISLGIIGIIAVSSQSFAARNNDNFINSGFWLGSPTNADIINALYGDGIGGTDKTAYTKTRATVGCNVGSMSVVTLNPGTGTIPSSLTANTVYVLNSGNYTISSQTSLGVCTSLIAKNNANIFSTGVIAGNMFYIAARHGIIGNIKIDGMKDPTGLVRHNKNGAGIRAYSGNSTIANVQISNIAAYGIYLNYGNNAGSMISNILIDTVQVNSTNTRGGYLRRATKTTINNSQFYNNGIGIKLEYSEYSAINNTQVYNNDEGITLDYYSNYNLIFNSTIYNNNSRGIYFYYYGAYDMISNVKMYNNGIGFSSLASDNNYYYGINNSFSNTSDYSLAGTTYAASNLALGWNTGTLVSVGTLNSGEITNPRTNDKYYLDYSNSSSRRKTAGVPIRSGVFETTYTYGNNLPKQSQPVRYNGTAWTLYGVNGSDRNTNKYIAQVFVYIPPAAIADLECFSPTNVSYLDDICFGIPESTLRNDIGQGITFAQLQPKAPMTFDLRIKNITFNETTVDHIRTRLGTFNVKQTIQSNTITNIPNINGKVFKKNEFEKIAKNVKL